MGSSSYITNDLGQVFQHLEYFPFGETFVEEHSNTQRAPYLFTGKELDEDTGLYYYGARYYDPRTSLWQSADPALGEYLPGAGEEAGPTDNINVILPNIMNGFSSPRQDLPGIGGVFTGQNLNLYHYSHQNPVRYLDPNGEEAWGLNAKVNIATPEGGFKATAEIAVDLETYELRIKASLGQRVGLKGSFSGTGFFEPSQKKGNKLQMKAVVSGDTSAKIRTPIGTAKFKATAEFGSEFGTEGPGLVYDADIDSYANWGPFTVDDKGRSSIGFGAGLGGSVGTEYGIDTSLSAPDTYDAIKGYFFPGGNGESE